MGPYLTVPKKEKHSVDGENKFVLYPPFSLFFSLIVEIWSNRNAGLEKHNGRCAHCSTRLRRWSLILRSLRWSRRYPIPSYLTQSPIGNEVAEFTRDYLIDELQKLESFKNKDYAQCLKDIYLRIDELLQTSEGKTQLKTYKKAE